jgi:macrolide transport system ATP-binding/permease protein
MFVTLRFRLLQSASETARRAIRTQIKPPTDGECRMISRSRAAMFLDNLRQDVRYGVHALARNPGFTAVAVLTIALGIGLNTAIFSVLDAIALKPLRFNGAEPVLAVYQELHGVKSRSFMQGRNLFSYPEYVEYRDQGRAFTGVAAYAPEIQAFADANERPIRGQLTTCNYFDVLNAPLERGRGFLAADCAAGEGATVVVLSDAAWRTTFDADTAIIGRVVRLNRVSMTVIGVAAPEFHGADLLLPAFWAPVTMGPLLASLPDRAGSGLSRDDMSWLAIVGRLRPGFGIAQARASLAVIAARIDAQTPGRRSDVTAAEARATGGPEKRTLVLTVGAVFLVAVAMVLLIACANVANLLLARATARRREIAVRLALGASRGRLVRQLMTESLLVALIGGAVGTVFALWGTSALVALALKDPGSTPLVIQIVPDARIFAYSLGMTLVTAVAFGLAPALHATRSDVSGALKQGDSDVAGGRGWLRGTLVGVQVAVCMVLLIAAGLTLRGLAHARTVDPGFSMDGTYTLTFDLGREGYDSVRAGAFGRDLLDRLRAVRGVDRVAEAYSTPLGNSHHFAGFTRAGQTNADVLEMNEVTPGFLSTVGVPLVRGRDFERTDGVGGVNAVIMNEAAARKLWPNADPVGQRLGGFGKEYEVVGVARDAQFGELGTGHVPYLLVAAGPGSALSIRTAIVHSAVAQSTLAPALREAALSLDRNLHVTVAPLRANMRPYVQGTAAIASLSGTLGALALLLAALGIYGTVAFTVARRTREIGIRVALGARAAGVVGLIIRQTMRPVLVGAVIGTAMCAAVSRVLAPVLLGVSTLDGVAFTAVPLFLAGVALLAGYMPARKAARVDPLAALRRE